MKFIFENSRGETLDLWNNDLFYLVNLGGQTSANTDISSLVLGDIDGDLITNVRTQPRTIALTLRINPAVNVEYAKREILKIVKLKQKAKLTWFQNEKTLAITGTVESIDMPRWNNAVAMQISIHCSVPFWEDTEETVQQIDDAIGLHYFTALDDYSSEMLFFPDGGIAFGEFNTTMSRTFYNAGDVAVGMIIEIMAIDPVTNPIIYDVYGNFFGVGYGTKPVTLSAGETIEINTSSGELSVTRNGSTSLFNYVAPRSTWLQLQTGENTFRIDNADHSTGNMVFSLIYKQRYI